MGIRVSLDSRDDALSTTGEVFVHAGNNYRYPQADGNPNERVMLAPQEVRKLSTDLPGGCDSALLESRFVLRVEILMKGLKLLKGKGLQNFVLALY